jgi:hypothetical protein
MDTATMILIPGSKLGPSRLAEQQDGEPKKRPQVSAALFASEHNQTISEEYQECEDVDLRQPKENSDKTDKSIQIRHFGSCIWPC